MSIQLNHLTHVYNEGTTFEKVALNDVTLEIQTGEFIGLIGHTGSGKSTLIQHLNGIISPSSGEILLDGENIHKDKAKLKEVRRRIGLAFQYPEYQLFEMTVYKDVAFGPTNLGLSAEQIHENVVAALNIVGIDETFYEKSPFELSGGQKRRVAIAGVLAMNPEVLILDEPTAGLDVMVREEILDLLREFMIPGDRSILISSHISSDLEHLCDDIYVIHKGKIVLHEEMDTILEKYAVLKVSEAQYQAVDKSYILKEKKENFGISCLTNEKQYYIENYPEIVVESGSLDQVILMLTGGER